MVVLLQLRFDCCQHLIAIVVEKRFDGCCGLLFYSLLQCYN